MHPVGLFKVGGHFGQQAVGRNTHIDRKAQLTLDAAADGVGNRQRRAEQRLGAGHIQKRLVNAVLLHIRRVVAQNLNQCLTVLHVKVKIGRYNRQPRALGAGGKQALAGLDTVLFGRAAFGQHHAVALGFIAAHHRGYRAQVLHIAVLQMLERRP